MIKRLNVRKFLPIVVNNCKEEYYKELLLAENDECIVELYGSYFKNKLLGFFYLETFQNCAYNIGIIRHEGGQEFFYDLIRMLDFCMLFLDYAYFDIVDDSHEARLVKMINRRKPQYKIREIGRESFKDKIVIKYKAGSYQ